MSGHTPGPWKVRKHWSDSGCYEVYPTRGKKPRIGQWSAIAEITDGASKGESVRANACLIAAAPDMLDALRKAVILLAGASVHAPELEPMEAYEAVSRAIAKATGQPAGEGEK